MKRLLSLLFGLTLLVGCAEPGDATRTGALGGGAVGAGLGAIIGSQTGDPGAGVAIGALAGAGAGAAIGNAFDARDAAIRNQDEAIARQEQLLRAQQKEIRDLREISQDGSPYDSDNGSSPKARFGGEQFGSASRPGMVRVPAGPLKIPAHLRPQQEEFASLQVRSPEGNTHNTLAQNTMAYDSSFRTFDTPSEPTIDTPQAREQRLKAFKSPERGSTHSLQDRDIPQDSGHDSIGAVEPAFYGAGTETGASDVSSVSQGVSRDNVAVRDSLVEESDITLEDGSEPTRPAFEEVEHGQTFEPQREVAVNSAKVNPQPLSAECRDAQSEIEQAQGANDTADKLFYYRRALRLCPDNPTYHTGMGDLYVSLGRSEDARFEFSEALRLDPTNEGATAGMKNLQKGSASDVAGAIIKGTSAERY